MNVDDERPDDSGDQAEEQHDRVDPRCVASTITTTRNTMNFNSQPPSTMPKKAPTNMSEP